MGDVRQPHADAYRRHRCAGTGRAGGDTGDAVEPAGRALPVAPRSAGALNLVIADRNRRRRFRSDDKASAPKKWRSLRLPNARPRRARRAPSDRIGGLYAFNIQRRRDRTVRDGAVAGSGADPHRFRKLRNHRTARINRSRHAGDQRCRDRRDRLLFCIEARRAFHRRQRPGTGQILGLAQSEIRRCSDSWCLRR